jgi:hypothetical protein
MAAAGSIWPKAPIALSQDSQVHCAILVELFVEQCSGAHTCIDDATLTTCCTVGAAQSREVVC